MSRERTPRCVSDPLADHLRAQPGFQRAGRVGADEVVRRARQRNAPPSVNDVETDGAHGALLSGGQLNALMRLAISSCDSAKSAAARFSARWPRLVVPAISRTLGAMPSSHARATWAWAASAVTTGFDRIASR